MPLIRLVVVCFLVALASGQPVADFDDPAVAAGVQPEAMTIGTSADLGKIVPADLPRSRPPIRNLCDYSCATNISVRTGGATKGVLEFDVSYKPIPAVNSTMMTWLFENLNGSVRYVVNNKTYPMYLIFHPVDHMFHKLSSRPIKVGTRLTWCEIALTGCSYNGSSATRPWVCPRRRSGFTRASPEAAWSGLFQSKVEMIVSRFDAGGIEFYSSRSSPLLGGTSRVVGGVRHTWNNTAAGLVMHTYQWVGLMQPGSITEFDTTFTGNLAKEVITRELLGGAQNIPGGNMTSYGWLSALHFLQEYWGVGAWLPQVYAGRRK